MLSPAVVGNFWRFLYEPQIGLFAYAVSLVTGIPTSDIQMLGNVTLAPWAIIIVDTWMWTPYVMLICLAGLRSIPDYIYEAAEVDRASPWRQFWSITVPMALPFIMPGSPSPPPTRSSAISARPSPATSRQRLIPRRCSSSTASAVRRRPNSTSPTTAPAASSRKAAFRSSARLWEPTSPRSTW